MIGFDIDGVIANFHEAFRLVVIERTGVDIDVETPKYSIDIPQIPQKELHHLYDETVNHHSNRMQPYPGSIEALWKLYYETREPLQFMTARNPLTAEATERWLKEYVIHPFEVQYTPSSQKVDLLKKQGYTHFIDDRFRTVQQVKKDIPYTFLMDRPWNQNREAEGVYRVFELIDYVTEYINWRKT